jgi:hypothetical protein
VFPSYRPSSADLESAKIFLEVEKLFQEIILAVTALFPRFLNLRNIKKNYPLLIFF